MFNILRHKLRAGVKGYLQDNGYARGLLYMLDNNSGLPAEADLLAIDPEKEREVDLDEKQAERGVSDQRLVALYVRGVRKFPLSQSWYTIKFTDRAGMPVSSVFLGSNGVGKSSLYSSIEYGSLGHTFLADERGYRDDQRLFLTHNNVNAADAKIWLHTRSSERLISVADEVTPMVPPVFFCSEYDILKISTKGLDAQYMSRQLGLDKYYEVVKLMRQSMEQYEQRAGAYREMNEKNRGLSREANIIRFLLSNNDSTLRAMWTALRDIDIERVGHYKDEGRTADEYIATVKVLVNDILTWLDKMSGNETADYAVNDMREMVSALEDSLESYEQYREEDPEAAEEPEPYLRDIQMNVDELFYLYHLWDVEFGRILSASGTGQPGRRYNYIGRIVDVEREQESNAINITDAQKHAPLLEWDEENIAMFNETLAYLKGEYRLILDEYVSLVDKILNKLLRRYFERDIDRVRAYVTEDGMLINLAIDFCSPIDGGITEGMEPRRFLNTFRFKTFCFVFKFALMCCVKKRQGINFPFVVDDVFDSSDFAHRTDIAELIRSLCSAHDDIMGDDSMPLQIVFFTQDNVIAECVAYNSFDREDVKFSRLFNYYEAESGDMIQGPDGQTFTKVEDAK